MDYFDPNCPNRGSIVEGPHSDQRLKCKCSGCVEARRKYHESMEVNKRTPCVRTNCEHFDMKEKPRRCGYWKIGTVPCEYFEDKNKE